MKRTLGATVGIVTAVGVAIFVAVSSGAAPRGAVPERVAVEAPKLQAVTADDARTLLRSGALLADVREPGELAALGKLDGAVNLPLTKLKQLAAHGATAAELEAAKERPVILYCRSGRRSGEAGAILLSQGFRQVYNLGGYEDAVKAGFPAA